MSKDEEVAMKRPLRRGLSALLVLCGAVLILLGIASCGGNSAGVETIADGAYTFSYEMATYGRVKLGFETGLFAAGRDGRKACGCLQGSGVFCLRPESLCGGRPDHDGEAAPAHGGHGAGAPDPSV